MQDQLKASLEASNFNRWKHSLWIKWRLQSQSIHPFLSAVYHFTNWCDLRSMLTSVCNFFVWQIVRHVESWNISAVEAVLQIFSFKSKNPGGWDIECHEIIHVSLSVGTFKRSHLVNLTDRYFIMILSLCSC